MILYFSCFFVVHCRPNTINVSFVIDMYYSNTCIMSIYLSIDISIYLSRYLRHGEACPGFFGVDTPKIVREPQNSSFI